MTIDSNNSKDNDDIKRHLQSIEARLDQLAAPPQLSFGTLSARHDDEIDLREIWDILWSGKWWIIGIVALFTVCALIYALSLPNIYKVEVVLAPAQEKLEGASGLAAQYGGLAAMAGINLGGGSSDIDQAIVLMKSWPFIDAFVDKYDLKPLVMGVKKWDSASDQIIFDPDVFDADNQLWLREPKKDKPSEPTSYEVFETLIDMISISQDGKTGLVHLSVEHYAPGVAHSWVQILVEEVNQYFQARDVAEAARNIEYLRAKINETSIADMQSVFYRMVESQMRTLMLAEVSDEYLLKTVIKPLKPEIKTKPRRFLILMLGGIAGGGFGVFFVFVLHLCRSPENVLKKQESRV